jgi:hypothetical protein
MISLVRMYLFISNLNLPVLGFFFYYKYLSILLCMLHVNPRLLTWELPEWRQSGRQRITSAPAFISSHTNI